MQTKKNKSQDQVHILTQKVSMRFRPQNKHLFKNCRKLQQPKNVLHQIWNMLPLWSTNKQAIADQQNEKKNSNEVSNLKSQQTVEQEKVAEIQSEKRLKFALKMSPEIIIIGNGNQLDLINIGNINSNNFVEGEYLWSIAKSEKITHVCVQSKKMNLLVIMSGKEMTIYRYDYKRLNDQISPLREVSLSEKPKFVQLAKDGNICLFFDNHMEFYVVADEVRRRLKKSYVIPEEITKTDQIFTLFMVPPPHQNMVTLFFQSKGKEQNQKDFTLWSFEIQFTALQIKCSPMQKIYENKNNLKKELKISNYSKEIFLLNLGSQILALKKGYILDSANVNMKREPTFLQYIGNNTLLHISAKKIEFYDFSINLTNKPIRIVIKPKDSIRILGGDENSEFFSVIPVLSNDYVFIFQNCAENQKLKKGQLRYEFYLTKGISRENKMNLLFPPGMKELTLEDGQLQDKCDMAEKMGYSLKQIYLQLWNRTQQNKKQHYSLLIATHDYTTIKEEVLRKLKKASINFKEIINIEEACFSMLSEKVFSVSCTQQAILDYISSHFLRRKLQMFKDMQLMQKFMKQKKMGQQCNQTLKVTIRQYQQLKSMQIKKELINCVNLFCHEGVPQASIKLRYLLRSFRFVFRMIYETLLQQIIMTAKYKLVQLLQQIPQILPFLPSEVERPSYIPVDFYEGVWSQITQQEWSNSLHIDSITTIDNREIVLEQLIKSITFKRNWLSQHDMVNKSKLHIQNQFSKIKSAYTFYYFYSKLFEFIEDVQVQQRVIDFVEKKYNNEKNDEWVLFNKSCQSFKYDQSVRSLKNAKVRCNLLPGIPDNIIGKVFLLQKIYRFFESKEILPLRNNRVVTLSQFFEYSDEDLIKYCFEKQRSIKGLLLKDIKNIYKQVLTNHLQMFNSALLKYFASDISQISDLKYMLNRINNEKHVFHKENQEMYVVLIKALEKKLKIGTDNDIPIDDLLIYLEHIPLKTTGANMQQISPALEELKSIQRINNYSQFLGRSKINMSIYDILNNPEQVFEKLVEYQISMQASWMDQQQFNNFAFENIAIFQQFSEEIYRQPVNYQSKIFFIFLAKIAQNFENIPYIKNYLQIPHIQQRYEDFTTEGFTQFMYKWALWRNNNYLQNRDGIMALLSLVDESSSTYRHIWNELQFARLLSWKDCQVCYPISNGFLCTRDLREIVYELDIDFVVQIDILSVYEVMKNIQDVIEQQTNGLGEEDEDYIKMTPESKIRLDQVYEIFILKMINEGKLTDALKLINRLLDQCQDQNSRIIYPILLIIHISGELNEGDRENLIECVWYNFYDVRGLIQIISHILMTTLSVEDRKKYIWGALERSRSRGKGYNDGNLVFNKEYVNLARESKENSQIFKQILNKTSVHIQQSKEEFKNIKYSMIMAMLCNSPYTLAKFITCSDEKNVRSIRSFLSYAILEDAFEPFCLLEMGRRIFLVILQSEIKQFPIENVIIEFEKMEIDQDVEINDYVPPVETDTFESIMWKSSEAFRKKKIALKDDIGDKNKNNEKVNMEKKVRKQFEDVDSKKLILPNDYIFEDSDNEDTQMNEIKETTWLKKSKMETIFQPRAERKAVFDSTRFNKPYSLYKSTQGHELNFRPNNKLFVSTRNQNSKIHNLKNGNKTPQKQTRLNIDALGLPGLTMTISHEQFEESVHSPSFQQSLRADKLQIDSQRLSPGSSAFSQNVSQFEPNLVKVESLEHEGYEEMLPVRNSYEGQAMKIEQDFSQADNHNKSNSAVSNNYHIEVKQVNEMQQDQDFNDIPSIKVPNIQYQYGDLANRIIDQNKNVIDGKYDFNCLKNYHDNIALLQILKEMYKKSVRGEMLPMINLMGGIIQNFEGLGISPELFNTFIRALECQMKIITDIDFRLLVDERTLFRKYSNEREIFDAIYANLLKYIDTENVYFCCKFITKVFNDPFLEQQVLWDFVLGLCERMQGEQKQFNKEKIEATLPKIDVRIWNRKFDRFRSVVFESDQMDDLIVVFCKGIKSKTPKKECLQFLERVKSIYDHQSVKDAIEFFETQ